MSNILPAGAPAPDFTLHARPDQTLALKGLRGRPVILAFYPADWSPVCGDQMALYNEVLPEFQRFNDWQSAAHKGLASTKMRCGKSLYSSLFIIIIVIWNCGVFLSLEWLAGMRGEISAPHSTECSPVPTGSHRCKAITESKG